VSQTGVASWYGPGFHGRMTANGEVYNQFGMTAAHKTLPFGSRVRVTNLHTGQSIEVRINDRGPYIRGRIIDLSYTAARQVGVHKPGVAPVHIEVLPPDASAKSS
jgi:rare lipoprotein A